MAQKPSIPKGTRDFSPMEMAKRNYIFDTIKQVYQLYGFQQIETPAMETLGTLMGKYGEEGDKLLFKVLNSGDFLAKTTDEELQERNSLHLAAKLCEKGLRYDLTVPFARYVVMHREELQLPFKRYQMQPVWRADRPQKGRYREFWQFDGDIVGSDSLLNEVELMQIVDTVFSRKILTGIAEVIGAAEKIVDITVAIDKLDKIGLDNVNQELREDGLSEEQIEKLQPIISLEGTNDEKLNTIAEVLASSETGLKGIEETRFILDTLKTLGLKNDIQLDLTLARGLNYYTGAIFEVKALDVQIGSITGGGRYDNLTGIFGMPGISGVGISFGVDRIFVLLLVGIRERLVEVSQVLCFYFQCKTFLVLLDGLVHLLIAQEGVAIVQVVKVRVVDAVLMNLGEQCVTKLHSFGELLQLVSAEELISAVKV